PAGMGEVAGQRMGRVDRQRHQLGSVTRGVAEHQPLIAGTQPGVGLAVAAVALLPGGVDARGDVRGLRADRDLDAAGVRVEALLRGVVADLADHITHDAVDVAVPGGADLASHVHQAGGDHGLHRDPGVPVLDQQAVEDRVGDLDAHLVGVPFGDRLGREGAQLAGGHGVQGTSARRPASSSITAWATSVLLPSDSARSSPRWSRIRTALSLEPKTPAVTSLKTSRSAPLRRALARARARALLPSWPVSAAKPTITGRGDRSRSTTL